MPDNTDKIADCEAKIQRKAEHLKNLSASISRDRETLDELKRTHTALRIKPKVKNYITLDDCENAGLNNRICRWPYGKCELHNCLLTYTDVRRRKCQMKSCKHFEFVSDVFERLVCNDG